MADHIDQMFDTCEDVVKREGVMIGAKRLHDAIFAAHDRCTTDNEYNAVMTAHDIVKRQLDASVPAPQNVDAVEEMKKAWRRSYFTLMASEATKGRSEMDTDHLLRILVREILAGRIANDDPAVVEIRQIQQKAQQATAPKKRTLFGRMFR